MNNPLCQLSQYGQAYWIDNLTRGMIKSGALKTRVTEYGLRGMTSNPAIFHKAIAGSNDYDAQIQHLVQEGLAIDEIYEQLIVTDIRDACDILRSVYDATDGIDGYVSLEVFPYLAHDTEGTMQEVRRLWHAVDRPNLFVKIPGTSAGVPAIEEMLYEGININITLLFSVRAYEAVAHAYIRAMGRRVAEGQPVRHVASVASFFLSRIDVLIDQLLGYRLQPARPRGETPRPEQLIGKVAIANAKLAYQSFKNIFSGPRWESLAAQGARVQRPLWASTSTKDPLYQDVRYVEPLIGPCTVNTMPDETIDAFADHGVIRENSVEADLEQAHQTLHDLSTVGVDLDHVFGDLPDRSMAPAVPAAVFVPTDPLLVRLPFPQSSCVFGHVGVRPTSPDYIPAMVLNHVVDGGALTSRLFVELREKRGLVYSVRTMLEPLAHGSLLIGAFATEN